MPLIVDGDITSGWIRKERRLLKKLYELTFKARSQSFKNFVDGISRTTELPRDRVLRSAPIREYLRKVAGI